MPGQARTRLAITALLWALVPMEELRAGGVDAPSRSCSAAAVSVRDARDAERTFDDPNPLLRQPAQSWKVIGPGALQAIVRHNEQKKSVLFVADTAAGTSRLVADLFVSGPVRWSPDGKRLAVVSWESRQRAWVPTIVDLATNSVVRPACELMGVRLKWSPDGKWLALDGRVREELVSVLWVMNTATGACAVLDTMAVYATYDFGWSPDSRSLAVTRPSRLGKDEGVVAADLWLFNLDRTRCRLRATPHAVERNPRWLDARRIVFREEPDGLSAPVREVVMTLSRK